MGWKSGVASVCLSGLVKVQFPERRLGLHASHITSFEDSDPESTIPMSFKDPDPESAIPVSFRTPIRNPGGG